MWYGLFDPIEKIWSNLKNAAVLSFQKALKWAYPKTEH